MNNILKIFTLLFTFTVFSCSNPSNPSEPVITVNGTVTDAFNNPAPNINIKINDTELRTDASGNFSLQNVTTPYDLYVDYMNISIPTGIKFESVFNDNPKINIFDYVVTNNQNNQQNQISLPSLPSGQKYILIITNTSNVQIIRETTGNINFVSHWIGNSEINCNLIAIVYDNTNKLFLRSFIKPYLLKTNTVQSNSYNEADFNITLNNILYSGNITKPAGSNTSELVGGLNFLSYNNFWQNYSFADIVVGNTYSFYAPDNLPLNPKLFLYSRTTSSDYDVLYNSYISISAGTNITIPAGPKVTTPMSNGTTMGYDDFFSIDEGGGNGIYMYNFDKPGQQIRVYSRSSSVKIPKFINVSLNLQSGSEYYLWLDKLYGVENVNELTRYSLFDLRNLNGRGTANPVTFNAR
ncbi:MAG TPA: carboxypeptidase-like regulatory domain-containing protein [Ignavibacteria bacterium]|nr:carboxypeptidase-like regulatory domain-containing protein [Ignavibacteria bacterium]